MTLAELQIWEVKPMATNPSNFANPTAAIAGPGTTETAVGPAPGSNPTITPTNPALNNADPVALLATLMPQPGDDNAGQVSTPLAAPGGLAAMPTWAWLVLAAIAGLVAWHHRKKFL